MRVFVNEPRPQVSFLEAWQCFFKNFAVFTGRANRSEFWWVMICGIIVNPILWVLTDTIGTRYSAHHVDYLNNFGTITFVMLLAYDFILLIPTVSLSVRRLHDIGMTGWFFLIALIPFLGLLVVWAFSLQGSRVEGYRFDGRDQPWHPKTS